MVSTQSGILMETNEVHPSNALSGIEVKVEPVGIMTCTTSALSLKTPGRIPETGVVNFITLDSGLDGTIKMFPFSKMTPLSEV